MQNQNDLATKAIEQATRIGAQAPEAFVQQALGPVAGLPVIALVPNPDTGDLVSVSSPGFNGMNDDMRGILIDQSIALLERLRKPVHER